MDERLGELTVGRFLERLSTSDPTPGGGSAAALAGATSAALIHMVVELSSGRQEATAVRRLTRHGILVMPLQRYQRRIIHHGIVVNYAQLPTHEASSAAEAIRHATKDRQFT